MDNFAIGDVVQLKSGGPIMTVTGRVQSTGAVETHWFVPAADQFGKVCHTTFPPAALKKVDA